MSKVALITGITGQDGSYLSEYLLELGYEVHGIVRRLSVAENQTERIQHVDEQITCHYGDLLDEHSLYRIIEEVQPDEVYNLAAMSHVRVSFDMPSFTIKTNSLGVLNILEALRTRSPHSKFYQASSSEMFGNSIDEDKFQRLTTPMIPVSPYGASKLMGYDLTRQYREGYKLHACNGVLFNHESPRRGTNFVTNKVVKGAVEIKLGLRDKLELGNLDSYRDWGHSYDYVRAMHLILNHHEPRDWVVSTGETKSVRDLCDYTFKFLNMDYRNYVIQRDKYFRKEEVNYLRGDSSEIKFNLGWKTKYTFESMIDEMVKYWIKNLER
jgi:GDPmannose 4,6-dehydratase